MYLIPSASKTLARSDTQGAGPCCLQSDLRFSLFPRKGIVLELKTRRSGFTLKATMSIIPQGFTNKSTTLCSLFRHMTLQTKENRCLTDAIQKCIAIIRPLEVTAMSESLEDRMNLFQKEINDKVTDHFYKTTLQKYQFLIIFISLNILFMAILTILVRTFSK